MDDRATATPDVRCSRTARMNIEYRRDLGITLRRSQTRCVDACEDLPRCDLTALWSL